MLYILEGNECNFKTTIAEKLRDSLNIPIVKGSSFELSQCTNRALFEKFIEFSHLENVILDRFIYSNLVYASLYGNFAIISEIQKKYIENLIKEKALIIYLYADDEVLINRLDIRGDEYIKSEKIKDINNKYNEIINDIEHLNVIKFNTAMLSSDEIVKELLKGVNE